MANDTDPGYIVFCLFLRPYFLGATFVNLDK